MSEQFIEPQSFQNFESQNVALVPEQNQPNLHVVTPGFSEIVTVNEQTHPPEEIKEAYGTSERTLKKISVDSHFAAYCTERGVNSDDDIGNADYCNALSSYVQNRVSGLRQKSGDTLQLTTLELLSDTPKFLYAQKALSNAQAPSHELRRNLEVVSHYNSLIRNLATNYPETRASDLEQSLLSVAASFTLDDKVMVSAGNQLHQTVTGARHEMVFGQILGETDQEFRGATLDEDLKKIDYVIGESTDIPVMVDVKASLSEIEEKGVSDAAFVVKPDGKVIMWSLVKTDHLLDKFYLDQNGVTMRVPVLEKMISDARQQRTKRAH